LTFQLATFTVEDDAERRRGSEVGNDNRERLAPAGHTVRSGFAQDPLVEGAVRH
jgi:hypothetical protein